MAQTISELERERAKLLEAIETQANQISAKRGARGNEARPHNLNDWLNAAEDVMPSAQTIDIYDEVASIVPELNPVATAGQNQEQLTRAAAQRPRAARGKEGKTNQPAGKNRGSFFGVIIMLALLMSVIGVLYIAYITAEKHLATIEQVQAEADKKISDLEQKIAELEKTMVTGGEPEAFDNLTNKINQLEQQVKGLDNLQRQEKTLAQAEVGSKNFEQIRDQLENKLTLKLEDMIAGIANLTGEGLKPAEKQPAAAEKQPAAAEKPAAEKAPEPAQTLENLEAKIQQPSAPSEPVVPKIEQKVIKLVESQPTSDMSWLKQQPAHHYTVQISASNNQKGLQDFAQKHKIQGAKIIEQKVDGKTTYVLVSGSYGQRSSANQAAIKLKDSTGAAPWVRQVQVLQSRVN